MNLAALKSSLTTRLQSLSELPAHISACCRFLSPWQNNVSGPADLNSPNSYSQTAAIGFQLTAGNAEDDLLAAFRQGASQLAGRTYFSSGRAARFEIDGVALLGLALGYHSLKAESTETEWLSSLLGKSIEALSGDPWQASLAQAAWTILSGSFNWTQIDATLAVSLRSALGQPSEEDEQTAAWQAVVAGIAETDPVRCAAFQGVFETCVSALARLPIRGAGIAELIEILDGISQSMSHWTYETKQRVRSVVPRCWEIDHEYHVQNLLWTVLRPIFPDLVDEETLKKLGHTSPRYDLGIPSLHTIIEVKHMRGRGQARLKTITDEVAADHSLYLREGTGYTRMIVFIWDEQRQTEEYKTLRDGLESLSGIERVIILPRPSRMERVQEDDG